MEVRKKILIADDTAMFRELGALFLGRLGLVLVASSGAEALEIARREQPDVLIGNPCDPGVTGSKLPRFSFLLIDVPYIYPALKL